METIRWAAPVICASIFFPLVTAGPARSGTDRRLAARIERYLEPYIRSSAFSGVVYLTNGDDVVYARPFGMANSEFGVPNRLDTRFAIASITMRFTSIILARLVQEKKISGDDVLAKWVPDFPSAEKITITHLANHYSGVQDPERLRGRIRMSRTPRETVELLKTEPLGSEPGATYSDTTANSAILAHVIAQVTGKPYADVVADSVDKPAGMTDSGKLATTSVVPRLATGYMPDPFSDELASAVPRILPGSWAAAPRTRPRATCIASSGRSTPASSWEPPRRPNSSGTRRCSIERGSPRAGASPGAGRTC